MGNAETAENESESCHQSIKYDDRIPNVGINAEDMLGSGRNGNDQVAMSVGGKHVCYPEQGMCDPVGIAKAASLLSQVYAEVW